MHTNQSFNQNDPFEFVRNLWNGMGFSLPGMVTPTLNADELERRIADMKNVENWLRMNLGMLQMTIQGLEMQQATLNAVKAMSANNLTDAPNQENANDESATSNSGNPFIEAATAATAAAAMWPWNLMNTSPSAKTATPDQSKKTTRPTHSSSTRSQNQNTAAHNKKTTKGTNNQK